MADEQKKSTAPTQSVRRSQQASQGEKRKVTTEGDVQEAIAPLRQARLETEREKEIEAQKRTTSDPTEAKNVDPADAERFERAVQERGTGSEPLPQRRLPTDNSLPNSDDQYTVPKDEEIQELEEAADVYTSDVAKAAAKKRAADAKAEKKEATQKYVVSTGSIFTEGGKAKPGDVVELTAAEARNFNRMGRLKPYIPEDDEA